MAAPVRALVRRMDSQMVLNASDPYLMAAQGGKIEFGLVLVTRVVPAARQQRGQEHEGACRRQRFTQMHSCSAVMQPHGQEQEIHNGGNPSCRFDEWALGICGFGPDLFGMLLTWTASTAGFSLERSVPEDHTALPPLYSCTHHHTPSVAHFQRRLSAQAPLIEPLQQQLSGWIADDRGMIIP